jgi:hypothetical protein
LTTAQRHDPRLYGKAGVADGLDPKAPLQVTEKGHPHRCASETECYDCGNLIAKGEAMVVSNIEAVQGLKGKSHRYQIHLACYEVVGQVINLVGKAETHSFEGRPSLVELWRQHHALIRQRDKDLAAKLEKGLGKP